MRLLVVLIAIAAYAYDDADSAIGALFRKDVPHNTRILHRVAIDPELDLVVAFGSLKNYSGGDLGLVYWGEETRVGLYLQQRGQPGRIYRLAVEKGLGDGECYAQIIRATSTDVVISCKPEKGARGIHRKFVFDARAKALVKLVEYVPVGMESVRVQGDKAIWSGTDGSRKVVITMEPGAQWSLQASQAVNTNYRPIRTTRFGKSQEFSFTEGSLEVVERGGKRYRLGQSTYDEFQAARPDRVRNGYKRQHTTFEEHTGPWQLEGDRLWFGKSFYDGEGITGVGGFGFFDGSRKQFQMYAPPEVINSSILAMLVETESVWLGLGIAGEWGTTSTGLAQFDRNTEKVRVPRMNEIVSGIKRLGSSIVASTDLGALIWEGDRARRYFVDVTTDGRLRVVEGLPVQ